MATTSSPRHRGRRIAFGIVRLVRKGAAVAALTVLVLVGLRAYQSTQGPALRPWHTFVRPNRYDASAHGAGSRMSRHGPMFARWHVACSAR